MVRSSGRYNLQAEDIHPFSCPQDNRDTIFPLSYKEGRERCIKEQCTICMRIIESGNSRTFVGGEKSKQQKAINVGV
jgi:hypothetical protein